MHSPIMPTLTPFLASVLEGLVDGIVITNFHGQVLYLNSIAQDLCQNWLASEHRHYRLQAAAGVSHRARRRDARPVAFPYSQQIG